MLTPVPINQPWVIWVNDSHESTIHSLCHYKKHEETACMFHVKWCNDDVSRVKYSVRGMVVPTPNTKKNKAVSNQSGVCWSLANVNNIDKTKHNKTLYTLIWCMDNYNYSVLHVWYDIESQPVTPLHFSLGLMELRSCNEMKKKILS